MTFFDAHLAFRRASREKKEPRRPCFERQGLPEQHAPPMMKPKQASPPNNSVSLIRQSRLFAITALRRA